MASLDTQCNALAVTIGQTRAAFNRRFDGLSSEISGLRSDISEVKDILRKFLTGSKPGPGTSASPFPLSAGPAIDSRLDASALSQTMRTGSAIESMPLVVKSEYQAEACSAVAAVEMR